MHQVKKSIFAVIFLWSLSVFGQTRDEVFANIYDLIDHQNFFKAREMYGTAGINLSPVHQKVVEAFLDNAFGRLTESNVKISELIQNRFTLLPDSLQFDLYAIKYDNHKKLLEYREAQQALTVILEKYGNNLSSTEIGDYQNSLNLYAALENQPKQRITIEGDTKLKIKKDKVGLKRLTVSFDGESFDFLFDTGANASVISRSVAEKLNMNILPVTIETAGSWGARTPAQVAICPEFHLGNIKIQNAVFLIIDDSKLSFSIRLFKYSIPGIIGYPVMKALKEVQITRDGYFIIPERESDFESSNMAMYGLVPLLSIENNPYIFDTGASKTTFYRPYYLANREEIESKYKLKTFKFFGVGGITEQKGYQINAKIKISDRDIILKKVSVYREEGLFIKGAWGKIGQDLIDRHETMTLNFNRMFIKFD
ncbi:MAG: retropepsin-like domain-containing protein [Tannerella sp.]|nr:retropepsin-like domain-containing protein [Tannerella sp.]